MAYETQMKIGVAVGMLVGLVGVSGLFCFYSGDIPEFKPKYGLILLVVGVVVCTVFVPRCSLQEEKNLRAAATACQGSFDVHDYRFRLDARTCASKFCVGGLFHHTYFRELSDCAAPLALPEAAPIRHCFVLPVAPAK